MIAKEDIVGTWKIETCEAYYLDGRKGMHPVGRNATGYILYNADGYMALHIMAERRASFNEQDPFADTEEEFVRAFSNHLSYVGRYELRDDKVIHSVELSSYGEFIGQKIERFVRFEDDVLYQTTDPLIMNDQTLSVHFSLIPAHSCALV